MARSYFDPEQALQLLYTASTIQLLPNAVGLSICRSIIEAQGGRLWASPNVPSGAMFQFTLPGPVAASGMPQEHH